MATTSTLANVQRCPASADLDSWSHHAWTDGVQVDRLPPLDTLVVRTRNSTYEITVLTPHTGEALVRGGRFFPEYARAQVSGASLGGSFLKMRGIYVGFCMELHDGSQSIVTTTVRTIARMETRGVQ